MYDTYNTGKESRLYSRVCLATFTTQYQKIVSSWQKKVGRQVGNKKFYQILSLLLLTHTKYYANFFQSQFYTVLICKCNFIFKTWHNFHFFLTTLKPETSSSEEDG